MKVSVIMPSYCSSQYISQSIESVINQTYQNWELIIVDDCSTDNSIEIIQSFSNKDSRIKYFFLEKNSGPAVARNKAIKMAEGRLIAFLDSDDIWLPEKLEKQVDFIESNKIPLAYSSYYIIDENGKRCGLRQIKKMVNYKDMLKTNHIGNLTGIYDIKALGKIYMDNVGHEDYVLWLKIIKKIELAYGMEEPLAEYRIIKGSRSSDKIKAAKWQWYIYRNIEKLNITKSIYFLLWYFLFGLKKRIR